MKLLLLSLLSALFLSSCVGLGSGGPSRAALIPFPDARPAKRIHIKESQIVWRTMDDVRAALPGGSIKGKVVDLGGRELTGDQLPHPKNKQDEKSLGIRIYVEGLTIKNGHVRDLPGGLIAFAENVTLMDLLFREIGEDAVSNQKDRSRGFRLVRCQFEDTNRTGDKAGQVNDGREAVVEDCEFRGFETALRIGESTAKKSGAAEVRGTTFDGAATAINVDGRTKLTLRNNVYRRVGLALKKGNATVITK